MAATLPNLGLVPNQNMGIVPQQAGLIGMTPASYTGMAPTTNLGIASAGTTNIGMPFAANVGMAPGVPACRGGGGMTVTPNKSAGTSPSSAIQLENLSNASTLSEKQDDDSESSEEDYESIFGKKKQAL